MRPIKFRAWLNYDKQMIEWGDLHLETDEEVLFIWVGDHDNDHFGSASGETDFKLMQYTGLTDKNGKEIYEGDAVDFDGIYEVKYGFHGIPDIETEQYVDEANGFYLKPQHDLKHIEPFNMDVPLNPNYAKQVKVIGNIYENPELMEGESE